MRELADDARIRQFMRALGRAAIAPSRVFFTGGASAVLIGWRDATIDDAFIPVQDDWAERSPFIAQEGRLAYHHFEFAAQALAKIERGHEQDLADVGAMFTRGLIAAAGIREYFAAIQPRLYRYPAINPAAFARAVDAALREAR